MIFGRRSEKRLQAELAMHRQQVANEIEQIRQEIQASREPALPESERLNYLETALLMQKQACGTSEIAAALKLRLIEAEMLLKTGAMVTAGGNLVR